jgi:nucleoid-associated protein YgaU
VVKPGDSLGKIANEAYGDASMWRQIYAANQYLLGDSKALEVGQRIVLP